MNEQYHEPLVNPELINKTYPEKLGTLYTMFCIKRLSSRADIFCVQKLSKIKIVVICTYMYNWSGEQKLPILKAVKRVILTIGWKIFAMYDDVPLQWIACKESSICCVSVCLLVDIDSWCDALVNYQIFIKILNMNF